MENEESRGKGRARGAEAPTDPEEARSADRAGREAEAGDPAEAVDGEGAPGGASDEAGELRRELEALTDRHLRLAAEFDNFRRRSQAELGSSGVRAQAALVAELLDVLDDFHRVTSVDPDGATVETVLEGVGMIERKLNRVLQEAGLEPIAPEGEPFDPNVMEAMVRVPTESPEEDDTVAQVLQTGFRFKDRLVRPARVSVRKAD